MSAVSPSPWGALPVPAMGPLQAGSCWNCPWKCRDAPVLKLIQEDISLLWQSWQVLNVLILMSYPNLCAIWIKFSLNYHSIPATSGGFFFAFSFFFFFFPYWNLNLLLKKSNWKLSLLFNMPPKWNFPTISLQRVQFEIDFYFPLIYSLR